MNFIICLIKGRNYKENIFFLKYKKIKILKDFCRKLIIKSNNIKNIYFLKIKNKDFKFYINKKLIDFLFIGYDSLINKKLNIFFNYKLLKINLFFLSIISNIHYKFSIKKNFILKSKKFKNINYLNFKNIKEKLINLDGGFENVCVFRESDVIFDIVSSGKTIKDNKIYEVKKIIYFKNYIIYNHNIIYNKIFLFMMKNNVEL